MTSTNKAKIAGILRKQYGKGRMVDALADHIDKRWDDELSGVPEGHRDELVMVIWNWFSGGDSAEAAAKEIRKALSGKKRGSATIPVAETPAEEMDDDDDEYRD